MFKGLLLSTLNDEVFDLDKALMLSDDIHDAESYYGYQITKTEDSLWLKLTMTIQESLKANIKKYEKIMAIKEDKLCGIKATSYFLVYLEGFSKKIYFCEDHKFSALEENPKIVFTAFNSEFNYTCSIRVGE